MEQFFRRHGLLVDFEITAGIPETTPGLMAMLERHVPQQRTQQQQQQRRPPALLNGGVRDIRPTLPQQLRKVVRALA